MFLSVYFFMQSFTSALVGRIQRDDRGQATAEYALVLLGGAVLAGLLLVWARGGAVTKLFDSVLSKVTGNV